MTRTRPTRASWSAAAVVSPVVAAMAAGSLLWAASNNPLATADAATVPTPVTAAPSSTDHAATREEQPSLAQLRKKADRLSKAVKQARKEARAARESGAISAGAHGSTWVPDSASGSAGGSTGGSGNGAAAPAPAPAPEPAPATDTWTGSSGG